MKCVSLLILIFWSCIAISQEMIRVDSLGRVVEIVYPDSSYIRFDNKEGYHWKRVYDRKGRLKLAIVEKGVVFFRYEFIEPKKIEIEDEPEQDDFEND